MLVLRKSTTDRVEVAVPHEARDRADLAAAGYGVGGMLLAAGAITLGFGIAERRQALRASPTMSKHGVGITLAGRF